MKATQRPPVQPQPQQPPQHPSFPQQPRQASPGEGTALLPSQEMEITADARTSRVLVRASKEYLAIMDQIVAELDSDPTASTSTYVVQLRNGDASQLAAMLQNLLRGRAGASKVQPPTPQQQQQAATPPPTFPSSSTRTPGSRSPR